MTTSVREATPEDVAEMHAMINELAEYEKAPDEVIATEEQLMMALFGSSSMFEEYDPVSYTHLTLPTIYSV